LVQKIKPRTWALIQKDSVSNTTWLAQLMHLLGSHQVHFSLETGSVMLRHRHDFGSLRHTFTLTGPHTSIYIISCLCSVLRHIKGLYVPEPRFKLQPLSLQGPILPRSAAYYIPSPPPLESVASGFNHPQETSIHAPHPHLAK
jgi:hypothetical protein